MVQDMRLDGTMKEMAADEPEVSVNGTRCSTKERPSLGRVVWNGGIRMLQERDRHYTCQS